LLKVTLRLGKLVRMLRLFRKTRKGREKMPKQRIEVTRKYRSSVKGLCKQIRFGGYLLDIPFNKCMFFPSVSTGTCNDFLLVIPVSQSRGVKHFLFAAL
jgi:hypothetical protein